MGLEQFYTRDKANEGRKLPLYTPDGAATEEWLLVRHVFSDAFIQAEESSLREARDAILAMSDKSDPVEVAKLQAGAKLKVLASLVAGWSFKIDCTPETVADFLAKAPQIAEQINSFAADSKGFFGDGPRNSKRGSKAKSA